MSAGSSRAARCAGTRHAAKATATSIAGTPTIVRRSVGLTPKSNVAIRRPETTAMATPTATPTRTSRSPCTTTMRRTRDGQPDLVDARDVRRSVDSYELQRERRNRDADQRGACSKGARLDENVLHELPSRGAKRSTNGQLPSAMQSARDEQIDRVRARDQQHASDSSKDEEKPGADVPHDARLKIHGAPRGLLVLIRRTPDQKKPGVGRVQRVESRGARDVRSQSSEEEPVTAFAETRSASVRSVTVTRLLW
jgi:hypothetical protein